MTSITNLVITLFKVAGAMIGIMYVFKIGPSILFKANYGPFLFEKLMMPLSILIPVGAIALSLLVGYGLLEFVGVYMEPIMRPIFKTRKIRCRCSSFVCRPLFLRIIDY